ncbi:monosaccharide ABC transporter membrane protein, CUT2 family [Austwickia chelonae]|uniref:Putative ABC transporter permease protein n=1 Tax=Austwickia chelonae NBRC 105200 TaxID=1184607 RepID=K6V3Y7_9MICO|nr:ABC transporter permease [Austwickia chelonae]GAB76848.1 putative ABC transporter permease protein [Austwickia chelonae NBRC 105200]SEW31518.1 monosaccharide ABC transporter membrane protein, CUT2 family [Austwickia chelonae]
MSDQGVQSRLRGLMRAGGDRAGLRRMLVVAATIFVVFSVAAPQAFLSIDNFQYVALSSPEIVLISLAMSLAMLTAGIDLSVVAVANLSAIAAAQVMGSWSSSPWGTAAGVAAALGVALACGLANAWLIARCGIPPILATLGSSQLFAGLSLVWSGGAVVKGFPPEFTRFALTTFAGIPSLFWTMAGVAVLVAWLVGGTRLGFRMRMVGDNPQAADFSGIDRARVLVWTYVLSAGLAGVAGLVISSRASGANSQYGASYVLLAIVVAVLAGVDPDGGRITVVGVVIAVVTIQMLGSGLLALQGSSHVVNIAQGLLLIGMVLFNTWGPRAVDHLRSRKVPLS